MNRDMFLLRPEVVFLNHGSFGACPRPVFAHYQELQREIEAQPVQFLWREFPDRMAAARAALAAYVGAQPDDLVFVPNATTGLNIVARSLDLRREARAHQSLGDALQISGAVIDDSDAGGCTHGGWLPG